MPRHAPTVECSVEIKAKLLSTSKSRTEEARAVERARIILACLEGKETQQVARELRTSTTTVAKWRRQFCERGLEGLRDRPRPGKPPNMVWRFAIKCWRCWSDRRPRACRIGMGQAWRNNWVPACTLSGGRCGARAFICNGSAPGA